MPDLPRLAVGTIQPEAESQTVLWALMEALRQTGLQVQCFLSRACFPEHPAAAAITGMVARHLDSWVMSPELCRETLIRGAQAADVTLVEGKYDSALAGERLGGKLEPLCRWFNLPRVVVLDATQICRLGVPERPKHVDGALLDGVTDAHHLARLTTDLEALWGVPVLGALERLSSLRARLEALPQGDRPPRSLCEELGDHFIRYWRPDRTWELARHRDFPRGFAEPASTEPETAKLTVAIAYDEAFNCYFQDTLDLLERGGASVIDFSPLRDEGLPLGTDVVYLGCGHPERHAAMLSENHCMKAALRSHLAQGRRVYGEGGGAAYLCQQMQTPQGDFKRMVGILPAAARLRKGPRAPAPVEVTLDQPNWLGDRGARLRGYRNANWDLEPVGALSSLVAEEEHSYGLAGSFQAIGSLVHLNFAAQPRLLRHFFYPQVPRCGSPDPWTAVP